MKMEGRADETESWFYSHRCRDARECRTVLPDGRERFDPVSSALFFCVQKYPDMGRTASPVYAGSIQEVSDVVPDQSMKSENAVIGRMVSQSVWSGESRLPDLLWHMRNSFQTDNRMSHRLRIVNNEGQMLLFFLLFVLFLWRRLAFHRSSKYINPELLPFYCSRFLLDLSVRLRKDGKKWAAACGG